MNYYILLVAAVLIICKAQDLAFPGDENDQNHGETPPRLTDKRIPMFVHGACPPNQLLYPGDQKHDWICDCGPGFIYYPPKDGCFKAYKQGPCTEHQYLILPKKEVVPKCAENPCKDGFVKYEGQCYELGQSGGPCKPSSEGGGVFDVNVTSLELQCLTDIEKLSIIQFPPNCPPGSRRGPSRCRPEY